MTTARRTRLVRVHDLHEFRRAIRTLSDGEHTFVVVPTRSAADQLRKLLGKTTAALVTRDQLYDSLHARLSRPPKRLTAFERDALAQASAAEAARLVPGLSFRLRPGLIAEMLRFYDRLRRGLRQVGRFEELVVDLLGGEAAAVDRGAARMLLQTRYLAVAYREYERRVLASGAYDEHTLRERLIVDPTTPPVRHIVVTVGDWIADPDGLFVSDFDLLSRLPGLENLDIVATEATLASGFHERLHGWWPGLEEVSDSGTASPDFRQQPALLTPTDAAPDQPWFTYRDREEELLAIARRIGLRSDGSSVAIVFKHPLPYLYLAPEALGACGIPFETSDALPLAAEPTSAAVDLVLKVAETNFVRRAIVALLHSPHFGFCGVSVGSGVGDQAEAGFFADSRSHAEDEVSKEAVNALDVFLSRARYLGEPTRLEALMRDWEGDPRRQVALPALRAAIAVSRELAPLLEGRPASQQIGILQTFLATYLRPVDEGSPFASRERRARAALVGVLAALADAHRDYHDARWTIDDLAAEVRRWIGNETFVPDAGQGGVQLLDDQAARYGSFDDLAIVGLVDAEWPDRSLPNIFYPARMLRSLGWPSEKDRRGAADTRLRDLLTSPSRTVALSTFTLDNEAPVMRSTQLDDIASAGLSTLRIDDQCASAERVGSSFARTAEAGAWAQLRLGRPPSASPAFHGSVGPQRPQTWSVGALETYLACPFKFFALHVLKLEEEPDDEEVMHPRRQGRLVHNVFETFFKAWQAAGYASITPDNLERARALFEEVVDRALESLPPAEAGLERTRLLGSAAASGLGDAVFRMEAERPVTVVERLLEYELDGAFTIASSPAETGGRVVSLRGRADRLDLLEDGTFRLIDYKLGWPPARARALQLPVYSICAEQRLTNHRGRRWTVGEAAYLAFKGPKRVVPLFTSPADRDKALAEAQARLSSTIDAIERGEFPPAPDDLYRCETCSVASVCRKDYVGI